MSTLLTNLKIDVPEKLILYRLQFKNQRTQVDESVMALIRQVTNEALALIEPKAVFELSDIDSATPDMTVLKNGFGIESRAVSNILKKSRKAVLLAGTLGQAISDKIREYTATDLTRAAILDAAASELADEIGNRVQEIVAAEARQSGLATTYRFSPGYSDWQLSAQPALLKALSADKIGLTSNASFILYPEKSITAVIGLEPCRTSCENCSACDPSS